MCDSSTRVVQPLAFVGLQNFVRYIQPHYVKRRGIQEVNLMPDDWPHEGLCRLFLQQHKVYLVSFLREY